MPSWVLVPCLVSLRNEFNQLAPSRDKASDGSIGDEAHANSSSDHNPDETGATPYEDEDNINEVHASDVDKDLRKNGWSMDRAVAIIVNRHREGRDNRLQNVIYNRKIWSRTWGWTAREYTGSNAHIQHAHFSARYTTSAENDTRPWGLLEDDMATPKELWEGVSYGGDTPAVMLQRSMVHSMAANNGVVALAAAFAARDDVDEVALGQTIGAAILPALSDALTDLVPGLTRDEAKEACEAALRDVLQNGIGS